MSDAPFDVPRAHRWFAVEFNNAAWELVEKPDRSPEETQRMLHLAHAAALHWSAVGKPIHTERAECLLATVYASAGRLETAAMHLEYGLTLSDSGVDDEMPFDRVALLSCAANIYSRTPGNAEGARYGKLAKEALDQLPDADDRAVITKLYGVQ